MDRGATEWEQIAVGQLCEAIIDCVNKTAQTIEGPTPFRMIRTTNVKNGWVDTSAVKYVDEQTYKKWIRRGAPRRGDVILTREAPLGEVGLLRDDEGVFLGQRLVMYRANPERLDNRFLLYSFLSHEVQGQIKSLGSGATVEHMRVPDCENIEIRVPSLPVQRKIGAIISAYDDLIENNLRRIKILEMMAQNLYREWFVKFRFPGHQHARFIDSSLGRIPEGWEEVALGELVNTQYGYTESAQEKPIGPKYLRGMDINKTTYINWDAVPYCPIPDDKFPKYQLAEGDIVIIRMADPGKVGIVEKDVNAVFASYLVRLSRTSNRIGPYYLFHFLIAERYQGYITGASTGTTRKSASAGVLTGIDISIPPESILADFESQVQAFRRLLNNLLERNATLRRTRDLLLPKLISGEVDVSVLDIVVPVEASA